MLLQSHGLSPDDNALGQQAATEQSSDRWPWSCHLYRWVSPPPRGMDVAAVTEINHRTAAHRYQLCTKVLQVYRTEKCLNTRRPAFFFFFFNCGVQIWVFGFQFWGCFFSFFTTASAAISIITTSGGIWKMIISKDKHLILSRKQIHWVQPPAGSALPLPNPPLPKL